MADKKVSALGWVIGGMTLVYLGNYAAVQLWRYPIAYCWGEKLLGPVFGPWLAVANVVALANFAVQVLRRQFVGSVIAAVLAIGMMGLPVFADILFRQGATCG